MLQLHQGSRRIWQLERSLSTAAQCLLMLGQRLNHARLFAMESKGSPQARLEVP